MENKHEYKTDEKTREKMKERMSTLRAERKEEGLCGTCGFAPLSNEHIEKCLTKTAKSRQFYTSRGLCRDCKEPLTSEIHKEKCHFPINSIEHEPCKLHSSEMKRKQYQKAIETNTCVGHSGRIAVTRGRCEECWFRSMARGALGSKSDWKSLEKLAITQNYLCAYTGEKIIPGVNASIDHKIPLSRKGTKTIDNIHWVIWETNKFKNSLTHEELLSISTLNFEKYRNFDVTSLDEKTKLLVSIGKFHFGRNMPQLP